LSGLFGQEFLQNVLNTNEIPGFNALRNKIFSKLSRSTGPVVIAPYVIIFVNRLFFIDNSRTLHYHFLGICFEEGQVKAFDGIVPHDCRRCR
jgi:hypothetical protein